MDKQRLKTLALAVSAMSMVPVIVAAPKLDSERDWATVINNNDLMPPLMARHFNSYNQPSVNVDGLVVVRARSRGGPPLGQPIHGIYTRDMGVFDSPIISLLDRSTRVPYPNNLGSEFVETPSFPRIDMESNTLATRGNHPPVWGYLLEDGSETRAGTTGIYSNPFGSLITGAAKLGEVAEFSSFEVPEFPGIRFEVFPGAPAVTEGDTIVFKGNYTAPDGSARTGVYFRQLADAPAGGDSPTELIANSTHTLIPGTNTLFGSTSPPSAAGHRVVFSGFDDENAPTLGGIYLAELEFEKMIRNFKIGVCIITFLIVRYMSNYVYQSKYYIITYIYYNDI